MSRSRWLIWPVVAVLGVLILAPVLALVPAAVLDQGPRGTTRATVFYVGLVASDPFVGECLRQSLVVAVVVTAGAGVLGTGLARIVACWRFWGRRPLAALVWAPMMVPPLYGALGLEGLACRLGWSAAVGDEWRAWALWIWAEGTVATALVGMSTRAALRSIEPAWEDAARLAGARRWWIWWSIVWPQVRPPVARGLATVFALTLLEPGAPMVLGLRRTLAYQMVAAAQTPAMAPRAAALAVLGLIVAAVARLLLRWWGRASWPAPPPLDRPAVRRARGPRAAGFLVLLTGWIILACAPIAGLITIALASNLSQPGASFPAFRCLLAVAAAQRWLLLSIGFAVIAGLLGLVLTGILGSTDLKPGGQARAVCILAGGPEVLPPLAVGVGVLMVPRVLALWADAGRASGQPALVARGLVAMADALDPFRAPGLPIVWALLWAQWPALLAASRLAWEQTPRRLTEAARTLGAARRRARRAAARHWLGSGPGSALILSIALAANAVAPVLVLTSPSDPLTLGPAVFALADAPEGGRAHAAALATVGIALNVGAVALARGRR
jgi:ABC-type Fe3+ transport system permease subunit